ESSWGGTRIEPWTPPAGFMKFPSLRDLATNSINPGKISNTRPRAIYNAMIEPIAGFAIRGTIWYQGESNLMGTGTNNDYKTYETKMEALVDGWREIWSQGDFPFYFVQIAPYKYYGGRIRRDNSPEMLPEFWELQEQAARKIKNAEIVLTDDIVDNLNDIHPRDKQDVGHRLALVALAKTYGRKVVYSGPVFDKVKFKGNKAVLKFDFVDGGLASKDGKPLDWFSIAGADGRFVTAEARIVGKTVVVSAPGVEKPTAVRFGWDETAQPNFCNKAGLPAAPFRTDESD
ncbi:MAG TPA: sialate O-acetylesterase, partial [Verrucomicrobiae bacterium]|nr:sialate O-acetylesterase [Verrucomicrobiae bacterium]